MVLDASIGIPRVPTYSGAFLSGSRFNYWTLTFSGMASQPFRLHVPFFLVLKVLQPRYTRTTVWALPISLAATLGIILIFFSSRY